MKLSRVDASIQFFNRRFRSKVEREFEADIKIEIEFLAYVTKKKKLSIKSSKLLHKVLSNYANFELIRKLEGEKSVPNIIRSLYHCIIKFPRRFSSYTSKLERSALLNVIREMSLSILDRPPTFSKLPLTGYEQLMHLLQVLYKASAALSRF